MSNMCDRVHRVLHSLANHRFPFDLDGIPHNGIYVLFEEGELAHGGPRIVRVGTYRGDRQLRSRLQQHFVKENKDRSIFRKNIGRCLLHRDGDPFLVDWDVDLTSRKNREAHAGQINPRNERRWRHV